MSAPDPYQQQREQMVSQQLRARGITDERVLYTMTQVPRHLFVPRELGHLAYQDGPLGIGDSQTISQPFIVAYMTQALSLTGDECVLEIGTGSGYQTAVLASLCRYVYSLERFPRLATQAGHLLSELGYTNVDIHVGDGSQGLPDMSPFQGIIVTAAAPVLPGPLCSQLDRKNRRMVIPVGDRQNQALQRVLRKEDRWHIRNLIPVRFVPLIGRYGFPPDADESGAGV